MTRALGDPTHPTAPPLDTTACAQHPYRQPVPLNRIVGGRESGGAEGLQALPAPNLCKIPAPFWATCLETGMVKCWWGRFTNGSRGYTGGAQRVQCEKKDMAVFCREQLFANTYVNGFQLRTALVTQDAPDRQDMNSSLGHARTVLSGIP